jgi:hypothetical protein
MRKVENTNGENQRLGKRRAVALTLASAFAAAGIILGLPAESQALSPPNRTDLGEFCALSADDCVDLTTGDYGDPSSCGPLNKKYGTYAYIYGASFATLCSQAKRWVIR